MESALDILECTKKGWCQIRETLRKIATETSSIVAYIEKIKENYLNNDILYLYRLEFQEPGKHNDEIRSQRKQIKQQNKIRNGGTAVRTRSLEMIEGGRPTKRYLNADRECIKKKENTSLSKNGRLLNEEKEIEYAVVSHYDNIFAPSLLSVTTPQMQKSLSTAVAKA